MNYIRVQTAPEGVRVLRHSVTLLCFFFFLNDRKIMLDHVLVEFADRHSTSVETIGYTLPII